MVFLQYVLFISPSNAWTSRNNSTEKQRQKEVSKSRKISRWYSCYLSFSLSLYFLSLSLSSDIILILHHMAFFAREHFFLKYHTNLQDPNEVMLYFSHLLVVIVSPDCMSDYCNSTLCKIWLSNSLLLFFCQILALSTVNNVAKNEIIAYGMLEEKKVNYASSTGSHVCCQCTWFESPPYVSAFRVHNKKLKVSNAELRITVCWNVTCGVIKL